MIPVNHSTRQARIKNQLFIIELQHFVDTNYKEIYAVPVTFWKKKNSWYLTI